MLCIRQSLALAFALSLSVAAHATPVTYTFNNTVLQNGSGASASVTGTIDFNFNPLNSLGDYVAATNFLVNAGGTVYSFVSSTPVGYSNPAPRDNAATFQIVQTISPSSFYEFNLVLGIFNNFPTPFDPNGATLCPVGGGCTSRFSAASTNFFGSSVNGSYNDTSGTLQAATATAPEPSSLILLASGFAGLAGMCHKPHKWRNNI